jgi:hypothetical protein
VATIVVLVVGLFLFKTLTGDGKATAGCSDEIKANTRWVCLTDASFDGTTLTIKYTADFAGAAPNAKTGYNLHIYGGDGTTPSDAIEGLQVADHGKWYVEDKNPSVIKASSKEYKSAIGDAAKVCARIAAPTGVLTKTSTGTYTTGNCISITRP